jgi:hypothetical protein
MDPKTQYDDFLEKKFQQFMETIRCMGSFRKITVHVIVAQTREVNFLETGPTVNRISLFSIQHITDLTSSSRFRFHDNISRSVVYGNVCAKSLDLFLFRWRWWWRMFSKFHYQICWSPAKAGLCTVELATNVRGQPAVSLCSCNLIKRLAYVALLLWRHLLPFVHQCRDLINRWDGEKRFALHCVRALCINCNIWHTDRTRNKVGERHNIREMHAEHNAVVLKKRTYCIL